MSEFTTVDLVDTDGDLYAETAVVDSDGDVVADEAYVDTDGDGLQETVVTGADAAVFPVDPLA